MDGTFKTYTSLRENLTQAVLDFLIFGQRNKTAPALCNLPLKKLKSTFCHPNHPQKKPGMKSLAFSISIQPYAVTFFRCSTTCASQSSPLLHITVYTLPKTFAPIRRITAFCSPNNPAAIDNAPKVLNAVCHA